MLLCAKLVFAAPVLIGEKDHQHQAEDLARDQLKAAGCTWTQTTKNTKIKVYRNDDGSMRVVGSYFTVTCTERAVPTQPTTVDLKLDWTKPVTRVDGSVLKDTDIKGFQIDCNGTITMVPAVSTYTLAKLSKGKYSISLFTVDNDSLVSPRSEVLTITI
jgi:hypothetical protein